MVIDAEEIDRQVQEFKLLLPKASALDTVRRHIIFGGCYVLEDDAYFDLRSEIARHFNLHPNEVLVVGSAKLGFSLSPKKLYRHFGDSSDIDVVIVSPSLFDKLWIAAFNFWRDGGGYWPNKDNFSKYLFQGWVRPDQLPVLHSYDLQSQWWEYFLGLTRSGRYGPYKIAGAIYKDWFYLEKYQRVGIDHCIRLLEDSNEN